MAKIAEDAILWCVIFLLFFIFFTGPGVFAFGGPLSFLSRGIAALKQYLGLRKQPDENVNIRKCLWMGIGLSLIGILSISAVVFLLASSVATGLIGAIAYFAAAGPSFLFWSVVLLWLFLRGRRKPEQSEKAKRCGWFALAYLVIGLAGTVFLVSLKFGGPLTQ